MDAGHHPALTPRRRGEGERMELIHKLWWRFKWWLALRRRFRPCVLVNDPALGSKLTKSIVEPSR